jgi:hypothetical protein
MLWKHSQGVNLRNEGRAAGLALLAFSLVAAPLVPVLLFPQSRPALMATAGLRSPFSR